MASSKLTTGELKAHLNEEERMSLVFPRGTASHARCCLAIALLRELIERRERDDLDTMAHGLAYSDASVCIECNLTDVSEQAGADGWFDVSTADEFYADVEEHVAYLDARGLIQRDAAHPTWIAVLDESEASR
jgi:hypothetical protein